VMFETPPVPSPEEEPVTSRDESGEQSGERAMPASHPHSGEEDAANEEERVVETPVPAAEPEDPLALAQRERDEYLGLAQRAQADFENYRKRAAKEAAAAGERAKSGLVRELLPIVDNLERALASAG